MNRYGDYTDFIMFPTPAIKGKAAIQIGALYLKHEDMYEIRKC